MRLDPEDTEGVVRCCDKALDRELPYKARWKCVSALLDLMYRRQIAEPKRHFKDPKNMQDMEQFARSFRTSFIQARMDAERNVDALHGMMNAIRKVADGLEGDEE
ncbi:MAG: hypothetical protein GF400_09670 [Candidatus Eisenbacteria bacterium]|nr:hypothetical protein [Candidatus Eisenbacteria bacterium]